MASDDEKRAGAIIEAWHESSRDLAFTVDVRAMIADMTEAFREVRAEAYESALDHDHVKKCTPPDMRAARKFFATLLGDLAVRTRRGAP